MGKKRFLLFFVLMSCSAYCGTWFAQNRELSVIFSEKVWSNIESAHRWDAQGDRDKADEYLSLAKRQTQESMPFNPGNWPKGWPQGIDALRLLRYAGPDAYISRIIGDFALYHNHSKEALNYYETYIKDSIIPHSDYMMKIADVLEQEGMLKKAKIIYEDIYKVLETKNFHGTNFPLAGLNRSIKSLDMKMRVPEILLLDVNFIGVPDFVAEDFREMFVSEISGRSSLSVIPEARFRRAMDESSLLSGDLRHIDELARLGKIINADYVVRPALSLIGGYYVFQADVFDPLRAVWFDNYEYKTQDRRYLFNLISRFVYHFHDQRLPAGLLLPVNQFLWNYEADSLIVDLKISKGGEKVIAGCQSGSVYILDSDGNQKSSFLIGEEIVCVGVSPEGDYFAWIGLDGKAYFADSSNVIRWSRDLKNQGRGVDIARRGRFVVIGINDEVIFKDRKGEVFWRENVPQWATTIKISDDSRNIFVGMENGAYWCFSDEGNILWKKSLPGRIVKVYVSERDEYNGVVTEGGKTFIFDRQGNEIVSFDLGEEIAFSTFDMEVLRAMSGVKGGYVYFLSNDKKSIWRYNLRSKVSYSESLPDGSFVVASEGKNINVFAINWE